VTCACGLGESTETHCGPIIAGKALAPTAEALMRSRYSAYVTGEIDWVFESLHPDHRGDVDRKATETWSREAKWTGLEIVSKEHGGEGDVGGIVEFRAQFELRGVPQVHHERAKFSKKDDRWYYVDGEVIGPKPVVREGPRIGRNDPCHCGSGKKYKKCHGKEA
jgi:SEC-C motif domain protein